MLSTAAIIILGNSCHRCILSYCTIAAPADTAIDLGSSPFVDHLGRTSLAAVGRC